MVAQCLGYLLPLCKWSSGSVIPRTTPWSVCEGLRKDRQISSSRLDDIATRGRQGTDVRSGVVGNFLCNFRLSINGFRCWLVPLLDNTWTRQAWYLYMCGGFLVQLTYSAQSWVPYRDAVARCFALVRRSDRYKSETEPF